MGIFSLRESIYFCPRETGFRFFSWSMKYAFTFAWFLNQRLLICGKIFLLFEDFRVHKARKLHHTRRKTCPFDELADGGLRTNHSQSNLEGLESAIMDKSLWTNLHFGVFVHTSDANTTSPVKPRPHYIAVGLRQSVSAMDIAPA